MASVNSRSELFPNRAFTPPDSVFAMDDDHDPEFQARMPLRHHSSYENMNGKVITDDTHHYEDPVRLKAQISTSRGRPIPEPSKSSNKRPRKKINETYEPVGTKGRKRTFTDESYSSDGYHRDRCSTLFKILAFVGFFVGLAALALVVMITLGMLSLPSCHDCKKEIQGIHGPPGPKGDDGSDGKPGKTGSGNMTLCRYVKETSVSFTADKRAQKNLHRRVLLLRWIPQRSLFCPL